MGLVQILLIISQGARVIYESRNYEIYGDTIITKEVYREVLIEDKRLSSKYGFEEIVYDEYTDSVVIFKAQTVSKKFQVSEVTPNAINIVTPEDIEGYPEYSNIKKIVVSFLNIEDSSKIVIHYKIISRIKYIYEKIRISQEIPVDKFLVILNPSDKKINYRTSKDLKVKKKGNLIVFEVDSVLPVKKEPFLPPYDLFSSFIEFTDFDWKDFGDFIKGLLVDDDTVDVTVNNVFDLKKTDISDKFLRFRMRNKSDILKSGRGTYLERAKLLYSVYKDSFRIALVYEPFVFNEDFPSLDFISVLLYNDTYYVNPDFKQVLREPFTFGGNIFVLFNDDTFEIKKIGEFKKRWINEIVFLNLKNSQMEIEISFDSITGQKIKEGYDNNKNNIIDEINKFLKVTKITFDKEKNKFRIQGRKDFLTQGDFKIISINPLNLNIFDFPEYNFYKKDLPLYINETFKFSYEIRVLNIEGELLHNDDLFLQNDLYSFSEKYNTQDNIFKCSFELEYNKGILYAEKFDEFKEFNIKNDFSKKFLLIKK